MVFIVGELVLILDDEILDVGVEGDEERDGAGLCTGLLQQLSPI
jgi:hypothetical protein